MTLKKMMLLGAMALVAAAFAAPASASAGMLLMEGNPIAAGGEETQLSATTAVAFQNEAGGISCKKATANVTITTTEVHITSFTPTECATIGSLPALGCKIEGNPESITPWTAHVEEADLLITNPIIKNKMQPGCAVGKEINITGGEVTATPDNPASIGSFSLSGTVITSVGEAEASGTLGVVGTKGTYEFE